MVRGSRVEHDEGAAPEQWGSRHYTVQATAKLPRQNDGIGQYIITLCDICLNERVCIRGPVYTVCSTCST